MSDEAELSLTESARRLGIPRETLRSWAAEGLVHGVLGPRGRLRFSPDEITRARAALGFPVHAGEDARAALVTRVASPVAGRRRSAGCGG
jgi:predicted site-specific integrase-resolvase